MRKAGGGEPGALERATGVFMALVPCDAPTAQAVLAQAARAAGRSALDLAATMARDAPLPGRLEEAVRFAVEQARCSPDHRTEAPGRLRPQPHAVREQLARFRALRRRLLAAPDDSRLLTGLQDAAYALCVLRTTAYSVLQEAELFLAVNRITTTDTGHAPPG